MTERTDTDRVASALASIANHLQQAVEHTQEAITVASAMGLGFEGGVLTVIEKSSETGLRDLLAALHAASDAAKERRA